IKSDPDWKNGDYVTQPRGLRAALQLLFIAGSAPLVQQRAAPMRDSADAFIARWLDTRSAQTDANDLLYQVDASRDYDPSGELARIAVPVLAINSADDFINPPELGLMEKLIPRVKSARYVLIPTSERTRDACFAGGRQAVGIGTPDKHGAGSEAKGLDDVAAAPDPAVHQHFGLAVHGRHHLG